MVVDDNVIVLKGLKFTRDELQQALTTLNEVPRVPAVPLTLLVSDPNAPFGFNNSTVEGVLVPGRNITNSAWVVIDVSGVLYAYTSIREVSKHWIVKKQGDKL